jgi:hypothetical protein
MGSTVQGLGRTEGCLGCRPCLIVREVRSSLARSGRGRMSPVSRFRHGQPAVEAVFSCVFRTWLGLGNVVNH